MRPIYAETLKQLVDEEWFDCQEKSSFFDEIDRTPTIDAAPVVRCKDCKYYKEGVVLSPQKFCFRLKGRDGAAIGYNFAEDDFCSYGERSEDG